MGMERLALDALYIVFQWVELARREIEEQQRQWSENTIKTMSWLRRRYVIRRILPRRPEYSWEYDLQNVFPKLIRYRKVWGIPGKTRRRRWIKRPNQEQINADIRQEIQTLGIRRMTPDGPEYTGVYYFPGL